MEEKRRIRELRDMIDTEYALLYAIGEAFVDRDCKAEMRDNLFYVAFRKLGEIKRIVDEW